MLRYFHRFYRYFHRMVKFWHHQCHCKSVRDVSLNSAGRFFFNHIAKLTATKQNKKTKRNESCNKKAIRRAVVGCWKCKKSSHELVLLLKRRRGSLSVCCPTHSGQPGETRPDVTRMREPRLLGSRAKRACLYVIKYNWKSLKTKGIRVDPHVSDSLGVPSDARSLVLA